MRKVPFIDATGLHNLQLTIQNLSRQKVKTYLAEVNTPVRDAVMQAKIPGLVDTESVFDSVELAMKKAKEAIQAN